MEKGGRDAWEDGEELAPVPRAETAGEVQRERGQDHERQREEVEEVASRTGNPDLIVICVTAIIVVDLVGAVVVRLVIGDTPVVMGDVSKVGMGGLVGMVLGRYQGREAR